MANQKRQRKSRLIALAYLLSRLRTIDATIMRFGAEEMDIDISLWRRATWDHCKSANSLDVFLSLRSVTYFRSIKSFREFFYDRGTTCWVALPFSLYVWKEAALSGGSYLGCLQSVKKKTEAPFGLAFSFLLALHGARYKPHLRGRCTTYFRTMHTSIKEHFKLKQRVPNQNMWINVSLTQTQIHWFR